MKKNFECFVIAMFSAILGAVVFNYTLDLNAKSLTNGINSNVVTEQKQQIALKTNAEIKDEANNSKEYNAMQHQINAQIQQFYDDKERLMMFNSIIDLIKGKYVEEVEEKKIFENALNGILSGLDPHSAFLNEKDFKETQTQIKGEFGGLGIVVTKDSNFIKVISPIEDTPAFKAGVKAGDYIGQIGKESTYNMSLTDAVDRMRGKVGEKVKITILRKGETKPIVLDLKREIIRVDSVKGEIKDNNIIYMRITNFIQPTKNDFVKIYTQLKNEIKGEKVAGVVLDLRNNPGGLLNQAVEISGLFLGENKTVVSIKGRNGIVLEVFNTPNKPALIDKDIPVAVLINEGSASASEIVAGALKDHKRGILLGNRTFGKASVQEIFDLRNGTGLKITTARYYTPSGYSLQADGIAPDIEVKNAEIKYIDNDFEIREKDLKGHLVGENEDIVSKSIKENIKKDEKTKKQEDIKDYQLSRAIDLIRGINFFKKK